MLLMQLELKSQAAAVWQFITDRQVEAPDEFASLQTHRVQLAVSRRQLAFVEHMGEVRLAVTLVLTNIPCRREQYKRITM